MMSTTGSGLKIRPLGRAADYEAVLDIQRRAWGHGETDVTPEHLFRITVRLGAILLGGWVGNRLAGFVYSFPAVFDGRGVQHSHLLAVLPEYQGRGLGKLLKWAQRDRAVELGYELMTWTFDPLKARNANLNLHTLGAVTRTYWPDLYGSQQALVVGPGVKTDRFLVEWAIRSRTVERRREGLGEMTAPSGAARALAARHADRAHGARAGEAEAAPPPLPGNPDLTLGDKLILAEIPRSVDSLKSRPEAIAAWQRRLRTVLGHYLGRGYVVVDFIFGDRCFYVLRRGPSQG